MKGMKKYKFSISLFLNAAVNCPVFSFWKGMNAIYESGAAGRLQLLVNFTLFRHRVMTEDNIVYS